MSRQRNEKLRPVTKEASSGTGLVLDTKSTATVSAISAKSASAVQGDSLPEHTAATHCIASDIKTPVVCNTKKVYSQDNGSFLTSVSRNV